MLYVYRTNQRMLHTVLYLFVSLVLDPRVQTASDPGNARMDLSLHDGTRHPDWESPEQRTWEYESQGSTDKEQSGKEIQPPGWGLDTDDGEELGTSNDMLLVEGDIRLGVILSVREQDERKPCGDRLRESGAVQFAEGVVFALRQVNGNPNLLPNITLGAVIMDDCTKPVTALARALHFLPVRRYTKQHCYDECSAGGPESGSFRDSAQLQDEDDRMGEKGGRGDMGRGLLSSKLDQTLTFYDVVGVIGAESSPSSIMVAKLLGMFSLPQISPTATSDLLSDKSIFPYFMRMTPPDRYQVKAMAHLFHHFNWTYVSAVYSKGGYGESGVEQLKAAAARMSVCIGAALGVSQNPHRNVVDAIVDKLYEIRARVVVLYTDQEETRLLLMAIERKELIGQFVLVGSDGVGINLDDLDGLEDVAVGALTLKAYSDEAKSFFSHFESLKPYNPSAEANPWFKQMWAVLFNCSWSDGAGSVRDYHNKSGLTYNNSSSSVVQACEDKTNLDISSAEDYNRESTVSIIMDTVYVFAHAIDQLIRDHCADADLKAGHDSVKSCIRGRLLLRYLRNTTFTGENGKVRFDQNGDIRGRYQIMNFQKLPDGKYDAVEVAIWDTVKQDLSINDSKIVWNIRDQGVAGHEGGGAGHEGGGAAYSSKVIPKSRCGQPCAVGQVYNYFKDNTCCWECRPCPPNERTDINSTRCLPCPPLYWPNEHNYTDCRRIEPTYIEWSDPMVLMLSSLSLVGLLYACAVFSIYIRHNDDRLIKSTSRELSYFMWTGVVLQYLLVFSVVSTPTSIVCYVNYTGFNVTCAVVYAPLLTRTNRIYRLFRGGRRGTSLPRFTSPLSQVVIASLLVSVQLFVPTSWWMREIGVSVLFCTFILIKLSLPHFSLN